MDRRYYCRRHPSHKQSKGVCPYCLVERLSNLTASSFSSATNLSNSSASSSSPSSSGLGNLFPRPRKEEARKESEPLKKSRSLAFVMEEEEEEKEEEKKKKRKFWSKLMGRRREEGDRGLSHSKTTKEKAVTKWIA